MKIQKHENTKMEMQKLKMRKHGNAKVENAETWKCKMYFMMSRLGHCTKIQLDRDKNAIGSDSV
jgi:hypothetical protein